MAEDDKQQRRSVRVQAMLTEAETAQLDDFAAGNHWTRSTAAQVLITEGLAREDQGDDR